jgi:hypothetical protein
MKLKIGTLIFILIFVGLFIALILFGRKTYRYECQDPSKYHQAQCQPPLCEVSGLCTKYLIGEVETVPQKQVDTTPSVELIPQIQIF